MQSPLLPICLQASRKARTELGLGNRLLVSPDKLLRTSEADKVRCGQKHFQALDVPFDVVVTADEF